MNMQNDDLLLVNAYLDGELDAAAALAFERRMQKEKSLQSAHARANALRKLMRAKLEMPLVSEGLQRQIAAELAPPAVIIAKRFDWRQLAASVVVAAALGSGLTFFGLQQRVADAGFDAVVAGHERALLAATPVDVQSSDHHTVKPWFDQHLAISPPVPELSAAGYELIGGRVEVVAGRAVPALAYKMRQHLISLVAVPNASDGERVAATTHAMRDGYSVVTWNARGFSYSAVSDIPLAELENFAKQWQTASLAQ